MEQKNPGFFAGNPEGAVIVALDSREEGLLFGAVRLRGGEEFWLDYTLEPGPEGDGVSLFDELDEIPLLEYDAGGRRVDIAAPPDCLLVFWNKGRQALAVDGTPLPPGELYACVPEGVIPWLLRFAG